jgi:hypothetical protein
MSPISLWMPGQSWTRMWEKVLAKRNRPSCNYSAAFRAPEELIRWIIMGISTL